jgi:hypothetical protein
VQVKKKMEEVEFCRNLRGVNDGKDFPKEFLSTIYHSISSGEQQAVLRLRQLLPWHSSLLLGMMLSFCTLKDRGTAVCFVLLRNRPTRSQLAAAHLSMATCICSLTAGRQLVNVAHLL